jgi:hypothetical protein
MINDEKKLLLLEEINSKAQMLQEFIGKSNFDRNVSFFSSFETSFKNAIEYDIDQSCLDPPTFLDVLLSKLDVQIVKNTSLNALDDLNSLQMMVSLLTEIANIVFTILENPGSKSQSFGGSIFAGIFQLLMWLRENSRQGEVLSDVILETIDHRLLDGLAATIFSRNASTRATSM